MGHPKHPHSSHTQIKWAIPELQHFPFISPLFSFWLSLQTPHPQRMKSIWFLSFTTICWSNQYDFPCMTITFLYYVQNLSFKTTIWNILFSFFQNYFVVQSSGYALLCRYFVKFQRHTFHDLYAKHRFCHRRQQILPARQKLNHLGQIK